MKTVLGYSVAVRPQEFVTPGRTVAANNINLPIGTFQPSVEVMEKIENLRIVVTDVPSTVISQKLIESHQGFGNVMIASPINEVNSFPSMCVQQA